MNDFLDYMTFLVCLDEEEKKTSNSTINCPAEEKKKDYTSKTNTYAFAERC